MSTQLIDPTTYPISTVTARHLGRPLFGHVIDGEVVASLDGATMPAVDPATGQQVATAAAGSRADVELAVRSARAAFDDGRWRFLAPLEKERRLRRLAELLAERGEVFGELDVIDAGLLRTYTTFIVEAAVGAVEYYAGWPSKLQGAIPAVPSEFAVYEMREPIGVIGLITPWNGPTFVLGFVAAALAAGNSVVLKPAEQTPLSAVLMAELAIEAGIPPGVFNVVQGVGEVVGAAVVAAPEVDAISFHRFGRDGKRDPGRRGRARQAGGSGARGQEPFHRLSRRRPRRCGNRGDDGRLGRRGTGLYGGDARARARQRPR